LNQPVVRIAVSGHRQLDDLRRLGRGIKTAEQRILESFPDRRFRLYSCLAEGSDQLLAGRLIETLSAELIAVLPLPEGEYAQDFEGAGSLEEFNRLKHLAVEVVSLEGKLGRPAAYQAANEYLIRHCDVLVVIWDGRPARGEGGTGDMVAMARQAGKRLLWIRTHPGLHEEPVTEERLAGNDSR
jgi:hypothetical protein